MKRLVIGILSLSLSIACGVALLASQSPDGLEHTLEKYGNEEGEPMLSSPMADYQATWLQSEWSRRALAGGAGTLAVFGLTMLAGYALRRRN